MLLAVLNGFGCIPAAVSGIIKNASKFLIVTALAAIGLVIGITDYKRAGLGLMCYCTTIDTPANLTVLGVIWFMGLM